MHEFSSIFFAGPGSGVFAMTPARTLGSALLAAAGFVLLGVLAVVLSLLFLLVPVVAFAVTLRFV